MLSFLNISTKQVRREKMKKNYLEPIVEVISVSAEDFLTASDNEVFVDGDDLFN